MPMKLRRILKPIRPEPPANRAKKLIKPNRHPIKPKKIIKPLKAKKPV